eukprot:6857751-Pyramimonas_sp.AAC.1
MGGAYIRVLILTRLQDLLCPPGAAQERRLQRLIALSSIHRLPHHGQQSRALRLHGTCMPNLMLHAATAEDDGPTATLPEMCRCASYAADVLLPTPASGYIPFLMKGIV